MKAKTLILTLLGELTSVSSVNIQVQFQKKGSERRKWIELCDIVVITFFLRSILSLFAVTNGK